jgi:hypothetical protein
VVCPVWIDRLTTADADMLWEENAFQSYIHLHLDHLYAIVMDSVIREILFFILMTSSAFIYMRATVEISSMLDDMPV